MHAGGKIYFDQDYPTTIMIKRSQYGELRKQLWEKSIKSHFKYPAKLKVFIDGGECVFNTAAEASTALQAQGVIKQRVREEPVRRGTVWTDRNLAKKKQEAG